MGLKVFFSYLLERIYIGNINAIRFLAPIVLALLPAILALFFIYIYKFFRKKRKKQRNIKEKRDEKEN